MKNGFLGITLIVVVAGAVIGGLFGRFSTAGLADTSITSARILADYREAIEVVEKTTFRRSITRR